MHQLILIFFLLFWGALFTLPPGRYFSLSPFKKQDFGWVEFFPVPKPKVEAKFEQKLSAKSWLVMDVKSGSVLEGKDFNLSLPPASLTKIVTALVALKHYSPDQVLLVTQEYPVGRTMGLKAGERLKVIDLLTGLLVHSANDAAYVLASNYPQGTKGFVKQMNLYVQQRGLRRTHFVNFDGEEDEGHYSTAYDLAQLARLLLQQPTARQLMQIRQKTVSDLAGKEEHLLETTNQLLEIVPEAKGLKTGWTQQAGECFVGYFEVLDKKQALPHEVITVLLGSQDRFGETIRLLNWVKDKVVWEDYSPTHSIETAGTKPKKSPSPSKT